MQAIMVQMHDRFVRCCAWEALPYSARNVSGSYGRDTT
jgi:hypothetical protein